MRHTEWMVPNEDEERRIEQRGHMRQGQVHRLHVRASADGSFQIVSRFGYHNERSMPLPRDLENAILDLVHR